MNDLGDLLSEYETAMAKRVATNINDELFDDITVDESGTYVRSNTSVFVYICMYVLCIM